MQSRYQNDSPSLSATPALPSPNPRRKNPSLSRHRYHDLRPEPQSTKTIRCRSLHSLYRNTLTIDFPPLKIEDKTSLSLVRTVPVFINLDPIPHYLRRRFEGSIWYGRTSRHTNHHPRTRPLKRRKLPTHPNRLRRSLLQDHRILRNPNQIPNSLLQTPNFYSKRQSNRHTARCKHAL